MLAAGMMIAASLVPVQDDRAARTVEAVIQCRKISDDAARLACFDSAVPTLEAAKAEVIREVKKSARKTERSNARR